MKTPGKEDILNKKSVVFRAAAAAAAVTAILYLFYKTVFVAFALPAVFWLCMKMVRKEERKRSKKNMNVQFRDMLVSLSCAMRAGYSVENALREAADEMKLTYGGESEICLQLKIMLNQLGMGMPVRDVFLDLAQRSGIEDINTFAQVFSIAQRSGGDMVEIIKKTTDDISQKVDTRGEIDVLVSAKRLECNIMMLMPPGIILYINISSDSLLDPLYGNTAGVLIMTLCLGLYVLAWYLGYTLTDISV